MNALTTLGLATMQPAAPAVFATAAPLTTYDPKQATATSPRARRRGQFLLNPRVRPSEHADPAVRHRAAAGTTLLASAITMVDAAARELSALALFNHGARQALNMLSVQADKLLEASQAKFELDDSTAANYVGSALELCSGRFCQLTPAQMEAVLRHMDEMIRLNIAYVPAPTPTNAKIQ